MRALAQAVCNSNNLTSNQSNQGLKNRLQIVIQLTLTNGKEREIE